MTNYKLSNIIKKSLKRSYKESQIQKKRFSFSLLNHLFSKYEVMEFVENHYCCMGEDICCWTDVENAWLKDLAIKEKNLLLYKEVKKSIRQSKKKSNFSLSTLNIFVCEDSNCITVAIPLRIFLKTDIFISFNKNTLI